MQRALERRRYGAPGAGAPNCQSNLEAAVRATAWTAGASHRCLLQHLHDRAYDANGTWEIRPPKGKAGDYMTLLALMRRSSPSRNCPILFNACTTFASSR